MNKPRILSLFGVISAAIVLIGSLFVFAMPVTFAATPTITKCVPDNYVFPMTSTLIIEDTFGPRVNKSNSSTTSRYDFHRGIDWDADMNDPVYAVTTGTVVAIQSAGTGAGGNYVHLFHDEIGCETRYAHLNAVASGLAVDATVLPGDEIGKAGDSGATHIHLHFEVWESENGTPRNAIHPLRTPFIPIPSATAPTVELIGAFADETGTTVLFTTTTPIDEPTIATLTGTVNAGATDARTVDFELLNQHVVNMADLDRPYVNGTCMIPFNPTATEWTNVYGMRMLDATVGDTVAAEAVGVYGALGSASTTLATGDLDIEPDQQVAAGVPRDVVDYTYVITNNSTSITMDVTFEHLSGQGWAGTIVPSDAELHPGDAVTVTLSVAVDHDDFGPSDCGFLLVRSDSVSEPIIAGFYQLLRDAYVSDTTGNDGNDGSAINPFQTIQHALEKTTFGGKVYIASGTYVENVVLTDSIDLLGGYATDWGSRTFEEHNTTIDGGGADTTFEIRGDYGPLIEGLTFFNGNNTGGSNSGGGLRIVNDAAPIIRHAWIIDNEAAYGGGVYIGQSGNYPPHIVNTVVMSNSASATNGDGGGLYIKRAVQIGNTMIISNDAVDEGGGVFISGTIPITFNNNRVIGNVAGDDGGGMVVRYGATVRIAARWNTFGCLRGTLSANQYCSEFRDNVAGNRGGAIYSYDRVSGSGNHIFIDKTYIVGHSAVNSGTIYAYSADEQINILNSLIVGNATPSTIVMRDSGHLLMRHVTIADNDGTAIVLSSTGGIGFLSNSIVWGNGADILNLGSLTASCNLVQAAATYGTVADPRFRTTFRGAYRLRFTSPAVDACLTGHHTDMDWRLRPSGAFDAGAFER